jgi:2-polyprenyl-3-methyl-5-hydroxy-6-metoxy-1,4-benzoquinol methylase
MSFTKAPTFEASKSFINFDSVYDATFSVIIIISAVAVLFFWIKMLFHKKLEYFSQEYWESRYAQYPKNMDWYCKFDKICNDFKIDEILNNLYSKKNKSKILELGCGNSSLAFDLKNLGYKNITSIDFSKIIINQMSEKYSDSGINCKLKKYNL